MDIEIYKKKPTFWSRQFGPDFTPYQIIFDFLAGIVVPILCLAFDPYIFTGNDWGLGTSILAPFRVFAYLGIGIGTLTLAIWLIFGSRLEKWHGFFAGILLFGALFAFILGIVMLPLSLLGIIVGIGVLGFTPFFTGLAFLRNGYRALKRMDQLLPKWDRNVFSITVFIGLVVIVAIPLFAQWQTSQIVSRDINTIISGDEHEVDKAVLDLRNAFWCTSICYTEIVRAYEIEKDTSRGPILSNAYLKITSRFIEDAIQQRNND